MLTVTLFGVLTVLHFTAGQVQRPNLTRCNTTYPSVIKIESVNVTSATLGQTLRADLQFRVYRTFGSNPALEASVSTAPTSNKTTGKPLSCAYSVIPKQLLFCGGSTPTEKQFGTPWNNTCPIKAGTYSTSLSVKLPDGETARSCVNNGTLVVTLDIKDEVYILDCVSFPVTIALN
ncbi:hypothetical protein MTO96_026754 [Rhipicephalus appendiculatus]